MDDTKENNNELVSILQERVTTLKTICEHQDKIIAQNESKLKNIDAYVDRLRDEVYRNTDASKLKVLLDSFGVLYQEDVGQKVIAEFNAFKIIRFGDANYENCDFPKCSKVTGYGGFFTEFLFDENGKFLAVGAWE